LGRGPAAAVDPILFGGQPGRQDRVDGELRRAVAAAAERGRAAQGRRLERVGRVGAVHEDLRRRHGRAPPSVRQSQAQHPGEAVRGPGHDGGQVQPTRVRTVVGPHDGRGAPGAGCPREQRGGCSRRQAVDVVRQAHRGSRQSGFAARQIRVAAQRQTGAAVVVVRADRRGRVRYG